MVDVDSGVVDVPEELPSFPQHRELADELREVLRKLQSTDDNAATSTTSSTTSTTASTTSEIVFVCTWPPGVGWVGHRRVLRSDWWQRQEPIEIELPAVVVAAGDVGARRRRRRQGLAACGHFGTFRGLPARGRSRSTHR